MANLITRDYFQAFWDDFFKLALISSTAKLGGEWVGRRQVGGGVEQVEGWSGWVIKQTWIDWGSYDIKKLCGVMVGFPICCYTHMHTHIHTYTHTQTHKQKHTHNYYTHKYTVFKTCIATLISLCRTSYNMKNSLANCYNHHYEQNLLTLCNIWNALLLAIFKL